MGARADRVWLCQGKKGVGGGLSIVGRLHVLLRLSMLYEETWYH